MKPVMRNDKNTMKNQTLIKCKYCNQEFLCILDAISHSCQNKTSCSNCWGERVGYSTHKKIKTPTLTFSSSNKNNKDRRSSFDNSFN